MNIQEFIKETDAEDVIQWGGTIDHRQKMRPMIVCNDGTTLSVQASQYHYCHPKQNFCSWYSSMEVGYPSIRPPDTWEHYFDGTWQRNWFERVWRERRSIWYAFKKTIKSIFERKPKRLDVWYLRKLLSFKDNATDSVYAWVPAELIDEFINEHGGINIEETFKGGDVN